MREKVEAVLLELESIKDSEQTLLLNGSDRVKNLWNEIETIEAKLKAVLKAGEFADISDQEVPYLIKKLEIRKSDLLAMISIEKNREVLKEKEVQFFKEQAGRDVQMQRRLQVSPSPRAGFMQDLTEWYYVNRGPIESFVATSVIVVVIQFCLNIFFVNQIKTKTQLSVIDPLEQELDLQNQKNFELEKKVASLQKEVSFYRKLNLSIWGGGQKTPLKNDGSSVMTAERGRFPASVETILSR